MIMRSTERTKDCSLSLPMLLLILAISTQGKAQEMPGMKMPSPSPTPAASPTPGSLYTRLELVDKDDLLRPADRLRLGINQAHPSFRIGAYTFGGCARYLTNDKVSVAIGSDLTFYSKRVILDSIYGDSPVSWKLFLRIRPAKMKMSKMEGHGQMSTP